MDKKNTSPMEIKYSAQGVYEHEEVALKLILNHFRGHSDMFPWKGYAGYTLVEGENIARIDLCIVTYCNVLVIELKDWNNGTITSRDGKWYMNKDQRDNSYVDRNQDRVWNVLDPKLRRIKNKFTNKGYKPYSRSFVVMCGNADWSQLPDTDKKFMMSLKDFIKLGQESRFKSIFEESRKRNMRVLNQDFDLFDKIFDDADSAPADFSVDGYIKKELIFTHPNEIYQEFYAQEKFSRTNIKGLMRSWDFNKLDHSKGKSPEGRVEIVSRDKKIRNAIYSSLEPSLYENCIHSGSVFNKDRVTNTYDEVYKLKPNQIRLNEFIDKFVHSYLEIDKLNLIKLLISRFAALHDVEVAHNDLGNHSIWISSSKDISLSNFICAYSKNTQPLGDLRKILSVNDAHTYTEMQIDNLISNYQYDVKMLAIICWHIFSSKRISKDSLNNISEEMAASNHWIAPLLSNAIEGDSFINAKELFKNLQKLSPSIEHTFDFDDSQLDKYRNDINHAREYKESQVIIETPEKEIYSSKNRLVKAWFNINPEKDNTGYKVLQFLEKIETLKSLTPSYLPKIIDFGIATKSSSLYVVEDLPKEFKKWSELDDSSNFSFYVDTYKLVIIKLLEAVEHLHSLGFYHGNIDPESILVNDKEGNIIIGNLLEFSDKKIPSNNSQYQSNKSNQWTNKKIDNFAVIQMCYELLNITWSGDEVKLNAISDALNIENKDNNSGYEKLSRFKSTIEKLFADLDVSILVYGYNSSGGDVTIYPDNGRLYVKLELNDRDPEKVKVIFTGVGGSLTTLFSPASSRFTRFLNPHIRDRISRGDRENCDLELNFIIKAIPGNDNCDALSQKLLDHEPFNRAIKGFVTQKISKPKPLPDVSSSEVATPVLPDEIIDSPYIEEPIENITTASIWKAIIETEEESRPSIEVANELEDSEYLIRLVKDENKNEFAIIPYSADFNILEEFDKNDVIKAYRIVNTKKISVGEVVNKKSTIGELYLTEYKNISKLTSGDQVFLSSIGDESSYRKRRKALERILDNQGVVYGLIKYFEPSCIEKPISYDHTVLNKDFERYNRPDLSGNTISLDDDQRNAFRKILSSGPVSALQGPPGTGKTEFIAAFAHYLFEKLNVKNVLLVSQSHTAVDTAAERIKKHSLRLDTNLEIVRFSNNENIVLDNLKNALSNSLIDEKRELFKAEYQFRIENLSSALGLDKTYLSRVADAEIKVFKKINILIRDKSKSSNQIFNQSNLKSEEKDIEKYYIKAEKQVREILKNEFNLQNYKNINLGSVQTEIMNQLGDEFSIEPHLSKKALKLAKHADDMLAKLESDRTEYEEFFSRSRQLVIGTCVGIGQYHYEIDKNQYDWVIIDEAARSSASELAIAMQTGKRILLVGDHKQLPPLYKDQDQKTFAKKLGINEKNVNEHFYKSDFERVFESPYGDQTSATLLTQYRMAPQIGSMVSEIFYDGKLKNGEREIKDIYKTSPSALNNVMSWIDTSSLGSKSYHQKEEFGTSIYNTSEANIIIDLLKQISKNEKFISALSDLDKDGDSSIGVICMYAAQRKLLQQKFREIDWSDEFKSMIKINTVDGYQGKENRIIIISMTRSDSSKNITQFMKRPNRINVALSRAMDRLIIVGSGQMWIDKNSELPMGKALDYIKNNQSNGCKVFDIDNEYSLLESGDG